MKKISIVFGLACALGLASCEYTPENIAGGNASYGVVPADPVIVGTGSHTSGKTTYQDIWVMNADGSNKTNVYSTSTASIYTPNWSNASDRIVWRESFTITKGKGNNARTLTLFNLKIGTISVSNGVPSMSNISTVAPAISGSDTFYYATPKWSSATSTEEIAVYGYPTGFNTSFGGYQLRMVDVASATASNYWTPASNQTLTGNLAWNSDGSKLYIATRVKDSNPLNTYITIIDRATATVDGTICDSWTNAGPVDGSRTGANQLLFIGQETASSTVTGYIYDFSTSTMSALPANTTYRAFTPDNAKILRNATGGGAETYTINGGSTEQLSSAGTPWDWKR